jgi:hypothetical protein
LKAPLTILREFFDNADFSGVVESFIVNGTNTTLIVDSVLFARIGLSVEIDSVSYPIESVDSFTNSIVIVGLPANPTAYKLQNPRFMTGSNYLIQHTKDEDDRFGIAQSDTVPFFFINYPNQSLGNRFNNPYRMTFTSLSLYFCDRADIENWRMEDYEKRAGEMQIFIIKVLDMMNEYDCFGRIRSTNTVRNWYAFGRQSANGSESSIFNDKLISANLIIDLPIKKCNCN